MHRDKENQERDLEKGLPKGYVVARTSSSSNPNDAMELKTIGIETKTGQRGRVTSLTSTVFIHDFHEKENEFEEGMDFVNVKKYKKKIQTFFNAIGALKTGSESELKAHEAAIAERYQPKWTALHHASANGQAELVQELLASGEDPNITDDRGRTVIDVAGITFYQGTHIESLPDVLQTLLEGNGTFNTMKEVKDCLDTPLHTAVELGCQKSIKMLLDAGASVACLNSCGLTPLHLSIVKKQEECLKILLKHTNGDKKAIPPTIQTRDHAGVTLLQTAVAKEWIQGVNILLDCGADVTATSDLPFDGYNNVTLDDFTDFMYRLEQIYETPVHLAGDVGNVEILQELLSKYKKAVNKKNLIGQTPLYMAVRRGHIACIQTLLDMGASVMNITNEDHNALHIAIKFDQKTAVELLLDHDYHVANEMINSFDKTGYAPIHSATICNRADCIKLLAEKNAFLRLVTKGILITEWTPLHIAAARNFPAVAEVILKYDNTANDDVDPKGRLPIHIAASYRNREVMIALLRNGAFLSSQTKLAEKKLFKKNKQLTALKMISSELPNPTQFFEEVFDSFIHSSVNADGQKIINVDYGVLTKMNSVSQIKVIKDLVNSGHETLLLHPLVESLICLKWTVLFPVFCFIFLVHSIFALCLYSLIIAAFLNDKSESEDPIIQKTSTMFNITPIIMVVLLELMYLKTQKRRYFYQLESWIKLGSIFLACLLLSTGDISWAEEEWSRHAATLALLLAWAQIMFLFARLPNIGFYVLIFGKVSLNIFKILLVFSLFIFAFALCFMIQYHSKAPFDGPWNAVIKTIVMMTSEFDYEDLFGKDHAEELFYSKPIVHVMFILFLIFVSIVFMNFMVGVAVSDVNDLKVDGNIRRLEKQVEFLHSLDDLSFGFGIKKCVTQGFAMKRYVDSMRIKAGITKLWIVCYAYEKNNETFTSERKISIPPHILDNIFNKIESKKEQNKEENNINQLRDQVYFMYKFTTGFIDRFLKREVVESFYNEKEVIQETKFERAHHRLEIQEFSRNLDIFKDSKALKQCLKDQSTQTEATVKSVTGARYLGTRLYFAKRSTRRKRTNNRDCFIQVMKSKFVEEATVFKQSQLKRFRKLERMLKKRYYS